MAGTLRTDPSVGGFGWSAVVDVSSVEWDGGVAGVRESVWVSGSEDVPSGSVRGDRVLLEGTLQVPDDAGFADVLHHKGIAVSIQLSEYQRLGGASNPFVRATQVFRSFVGTHDRPALPAEGGWAAAWAWCSATTPSSIPGWRATSTRPGSATCWW